MAVVAAAAVAVVLAIGSLGATKHAAPTTEAPEVVARLAIANRGGSLSTGYGSLWTFDDSGVLRLGPDGGIGSGSRSAARSSTPGSAPVACRH